MTRPPTSHCAVLRQEAASVTAQGQPAGRPTLIMCGGTATTAAALLQGMATYDGAAVHGSTISADQLDQLAAQIQAALRDGGQAPGGSNWPAWLSAARMRSMPAGCTAVAELLRACGASTASALVSSHDLLDALVIEASEWGELV